MNTAQVKVLNLIKQALFQLKVGKKRKVVRSLRQCAPLGPELNIFSCLIIDRLQMLWGRSTRI
jgi:hypothetical protein